MAYSRKARTRTNVALVLLVLLAFVLLPTTVTLAHICWVYANLSATNPQPWVVTGGTECSDAAPVGGQLIGHEHRNWHCTNPVVGTEAYGRAFLAFHRQFILDFDNWRLANTTYGRLEYWDPFEDAPVPGDDEDLSTGFTHCSDANMPDPGDNFRAAGAICANCDNLPAAYLGSNLSNFNSLGEVGFNLDTGPNAWHGSYHNGVSQLGCDDIAGFLYTPRDPAFWMAHKKLDEIARDWQSLQATDVVIVMDRSGSMDDNCPGGNANPGETPCALNDAREAARTFADMILDGAGHRVGLVSFASTATDELGGTGLVSADGIQTNVTFQNALDGIMAGGATSIAAGIEEAISVLNSVASPNPQQAILVLTDGKENTAPCLGGNSPTTCDTSMGTLSAAAVGDIVIVAVGFGAGAEEANLRDVAERHGGIFVAESNIMDPLSLQKFFVTAFGEIYDAAVSVDPRGRIGGGQQETQPFDIEVCGGDERISVAMGYDGNSENSSCDLEIKLFTPSGREVSRTDPGVEAGHTRQHDFIHVDLPYFGEATGTWRGQIVRSRFSEFCETQNYFYSVLVKGFGRVSPFVVRPDVVVGRPILATFRISESNRPRGGFDEVKAEVTLIRANGEQETHPLFDDGTNGDRMPLNNVWSVEIPQPPREPGRYHLRGRFQLTKDGCTRRRESEYSIVVQQQPDQCANVVVGGVINGFQWNRPQPGQVIQLDELITVFNRCDSRDRYRIRVRDELGWLKTRQDGRLVDLPDSFESGFVLPFESQDFGRGPEQGNPNGGISIVAVIPATATPGDQSMINVQVESILNDNQRAIDVDTTLLVFPPPDCNGNGVADADDISGGTSEDRDGNGVPDECFGIHFHPPGDLDNDNISDEFDNCTCAPNPEQCDSDSDGIGNACDTDLNNDGVTGVPDFNIFRQSFGSRRADPRYNEAADFNCDGAVGLADFNVLRLTFSKAPDRALCFPVGHHQ